MVKLSKAAQAERQEAIERVKAWLAGAPTSIHSVNKPTVYTLLRRVSASGMSRVIAVYIPARDGGMIDATWSVGKILGERVVKTPQGEGLRIGGCGMDMGFHVVYNLGSVLWPNGTDKPHSLRNGEPDTAGGYALEQRWM